MYVFDPKPETETQEQEMRREKEFTRVTHCVDVDENGYFTNEELATKFGNSCRICLSTCCSYEDPLISVCMCSGTMRFIHLNCLQEWQENKKLFKSSDFYVSLAWENLACELCKSPIPESLKIIDSSKQATDDGEKKDKVIRIIDIINIPKPYEGVPYVILNCLNVNTLKKENSKIIYIIYFIRSSSHDQVRISMG